MERAANEQEEQENAASELATWAEINMRILCHKNAKYLWNKWIRNNKNPRAVKPKDLAELIQEVRHFNDTSKTLHTTSATEYHAGCDR